MHHARNARDRSVKELRSQTAFVRTLLDEVERVSRGGGDGALAAQLIEELARLGCRCLETASDLSLTVDDSEPAWGRRCA